MIRKLVVAGTALVLSVASAHAGTIYYGTSASYAAAPGSIASGGNTPNVGGICVFTVSPTGVCNTGTEGGLVNINGYNLIPVTSTPVVGIANYLLTVTITGQGSAAQGSIWDVSMVNSAGTAGTSIGTTTVVNSSTIGGGVVSGYVTGNGTFDIGITDLFEQYQGITDTLPGVLGKSTDNGTTVSNAFAGFSFAYTLTPAPEPASMSLFAGGLVALGMVRRRSRAGRRG